MSLKDLRYARGYARSNGKPVFAWREGKTFTLSPVQPLRGSYYTIYPTGSVSQHVDRPRPVIPF